MINLPNDVRLTDELERQLMQEAIEEQARFDFGAAFKSLFAKLKKARQAVSVQEIIPTQSRYNEVGIG